MANERSVPAIKAPHAATSVAAQPRGRSQVPSPVAIANRARSNTGDTYITPQRLSHDRVRVLGPAPMEYNSRSTGVVPGILLQDFATPAASDAGCKVEEKKDDSVKDEVVPASPPCASTDGAGSGVPASAATDVGCTYVLRFALRKAVDWRGERALFTRGDGGAQVRDRHAWFAAIARLTHLSPPVPHQAPGVYVVGPFKTLRIRAAAALPAPGMRAGPMMMRRPRAAKSQRTAATAGKPVTMNSSIERPLVVGREVHLAIVVTPTEIRYYLDGVLGKRCALEVRNWKEFMSGDLTLSRNARFEGVPCKYVLPRCVCARVGSVAASSQW